MSPIQQMLLGVGAVATKTYVDDIFSTFLYAGNDSVIPINNTLKLGTAGVGSVIQSANSGSNALVVSDSNDFQFYNGDFTFECFAKINNQGDDPDYIYIQRQNGPDPYVELRLDSSSGNDANIIFIVGGISGDSNKELEGAATNVVNNNWHHIAATRSGSTWKLFYDGSQIDTLTSSNTSIGNSPADPKLFGSGGSSETFRGALSSFRIVKGTALYTSNFTPPTAELTAITNTVLLLGVGSTPAVDASGQNHSISTTGTVDSFTSGGPFTSSDAGLGGLVWIKNRDTNGYGNFFFDTVRGTTKAICSNLTNAEFTEAKGVHTFNTNGFTIGGSSGDAAFNSSGTDYASWTFRKAPGFFDVVTWTGNATTRTISHSLGSVPGLILIKDLTTAYDWFVYHKSMGNESFGKLNTTNSFWTGNDVWNSTSPTSSNFTINGNNTAVNTNSNSYVAYLFAGGESTAATAKCVEFDGNDALTSATSNDLSFGTGDYTVEFWFNADAISDTPLFENRVSGSASDTTGFTLTAHGSTNGVRIWWNGASRINGGGSSLSLKQWHHLAATRSSGTTYLFLNGTLLGTTTDSIDITTTEAHIAGGKYGGSSSLSHYFDGKISNFRIVKGTAVYTSSFKPSYEPLTNITNTKLLCCNGSTATSSTVNVGGISYVGNPTGEIDSPFDDPAGFVFGESGSENVIKTGSYVGTGSAGIEVNIGWEPQLILVRSTNSGENWEIYDSTRGIVHGGADRRLRVNTTAAEDDNPGFFSLQPNGFIVNGTSGSVNTDGVTFVFLALRRPDGYVGKPPELGTDVFGLGTRSGSSSNALSNVNVFTDFSIIKRYNNGGEYWAANARFMGKNTLKPSATDAENTGALPTSGAIWDHMLGHLVAASNGATNTGSDIIDYGWKRHAGFDVVAYDGNSSSNRVLSHSLNAVPQMIWYKRRNTPTDFWGVGVNFTSSAYDLLLLNSTQAANNLAYTTRFVSQPTATSFEINQDSNINGTGGVYIAFLFASVSGISKVGSYTGNGTDTTTGDQTITFGFAPRFVIIKSTAANTGWVVLDTLRGWTDSDSRSIRLDRDNAQSGSDSGYGYATSTGMVLTGSGGGHTNANPYEYIYYAHA